VRDAVSLPNGSVVVIGNFDGVHRGHQAVLAQARGIADAGSLSCVVLTFDPHPAEVLGRGKKPKLASIERRVELLRRHGADEVIVEPFTLELAAFPPERFAREVLKHRLDARAIVVGQNFRFGAKRAGDIGTLAELGRDLGFAVEPSAIAGDAKGPFSSTRVRAAIAAGDLDEAAHVLGRPHLLSGIVEEGDRLGRTIGFPTANLGGVVEMLPPYGVYAVTLPSLERNGVMNIGVRPTVGGTKLRIEAHVLDFDGDLYGQRLRVDLVKRLREERKMSGLDELKAQIAKDIEAARQLFASLRGP
jgi:riboflavin kinase / FMN adenylyltransferase